MTSPDPRAQTHFSEMFLISPFTKIAQIGRLCPRKWPPEIKLDFIFEKMFRELVSKVKSYFTGLFLIMP